MSTMNLNQKEQERAERIRKQYMRREDMKIERLQRLDSKVKAPGKVVASIMGVIGSLVMGSGMSFVMVWDNMQTGLALGIPGMVVALSAYPAHQLITASRKKKYADEIIKLSNEIIN